MPNYGQTSKEIEEEFEKEEDIVERKYVKTFPRAHSSDIPRARLDVDIPDSTPRTMNILGVKLPHSNAYDTTPKIDYIPNTLKKKRY
jgi:hypothetical protein